jgi:hypothetical protein
VRARGSPRHSCMLLTVTCALRVLCVCAAPSYGRCEEGRPFSLVNPNELGPEIAPQVPHDDRRSPPLPPPSSLISPAPHDPLATYYGSRSSRSSRSCCSTSPSCACSGHARPRIPYAHPLLAPSLPSPRHPVHSSR